MPTPSPSPASWVPIGDVQPWGSNPRINDHAVSEVASSIQRFGWGSPILVRQSDGVIIAGHTRHKAALHLGLDKVLVRYLDLDPAQARALALADNKLGELADWDDDALSAVLAGLVEEEIDIDGLGWSEEELDALLAGDDDLEEAETDPPDTSGDDDLPDAVEPKTKPGEVVRIGRHVLHCGDCMSVMAGMADGSVDAIVTDPPYGIGFMGKGWDSAVPGEAWAAECLRVLKPGGHLIAFAATRTVHRLAVALEDAGMEIRDQIAHLQ